MRAWKQRQINNQSINSITTTCFLIVGLLVYFFIYKNLPAYLTNDSAVELLQITDFRAWPIQAFIPTYNHGHVDVIESVYGYFMQPFLLLMGSDIATFKLGLGLVFAITSALFFVLLKRIFNLPVAILGAIAYVTSAYTIWWPLLLLRNAFCPLMVICFFLGVLDFRDEKVWRGVSIIVFSSFVAINTYSSFKVVIPVLFLSTAVTGFFTKESRPHIKPILLSGLFVLLMLSVFFIATQTNKDFILRGSYMLEGNDLDVNRNLKTYILFFLRSFFLPIYENPHGFLAEPTHSIFGRSMLNPWFYGIWLLGLAVSIFKTIKKDHIAFIFLASLILSSLVLCIGGPSLKTHFVLAPIEFIMVAYGINFIFNIGINKKITIILLGLYILSGAYLERLYMLHVVKVSNSEQIGSIGQDVGLFLKQHSREFDFVIYSSYGVDLMRLFYPPWAFKTKNIPIFDEALFDRTLDLSKKEYTRLWLVLATTNPFYSRMLSDKDFCFSRSINNREDAVLLVRCNKN